MSPRTRVSGWLITLNVRPFIAHHASFIVSPVSFGYNSCMRRRAILRYCIVLAALLTLIGCASASATQTGSPSPQPNTGPVEPIRLTIWHSWSGAQLSALNAVARSYEQDHPAVRIQLQMQPGAELVRSYSMSVADGSAPQLVLLPGRYLGELAQQQFIQPLEDAWSEEQPSGLLPQALDAAHVNGELYGVPVSFDTMVLFWDKRRVAEAPATWAAARELNAALRGEPPETRPYSMAYYLSLAGAMPYLEFFGGSVVDGQQPVFTTAGRDATASWLEWLHSLPSDEQLIASADYNAVDSAVQQGRVLAGIDWARRRSMYEQAWGGAEAVGIAALPARQAGQTPRSLLLTDVLAINRAISPEQRAAALDFARAVAGKASQETLWSRGQLLPVHAEIEVDEATAPVLALADASQPLTSVVVGMWDPLNGMVRNVLSNVSSPQEAIDAAGAALPSPSPSP